MGVFDINNNGVAKVLQVVVVIFWLGITGYFLWTEANGLIHAEDTYIYCMNLSSITAIAGQMVLWAFYIWEARLLYVKRCYSKLPIYLIYAFAFCVAVYYFVADYTFDYVTKLMDKEEMYCLPSLAYKLYGGILLPVLLAIMLIPRLTETLRELKEEQDLTI